MNHTTDYLIRASLRSHINHSCEYVAQHPRRTVVGSNFQLRVTSADLHKITGDGDAPPAHHPMSAPICTVIGALQDCVEVPRYTKDESGAWNMDPAPIRGAAGLLHLSKTFGPEAWDERLLVMAPSFRKDGTPGAREHVRQKIAHMRSPSATRVVVMKRSSILAAIERLDGETIKSIAAALGEALRHHAARDLDATIVKAVANIENKSAQLQAKAVRPTKRVSERA